LMNFRVLYAIVIALTIVSAIGYFGFAYAQEEEVVITEPDIEIGTNEIVIVLIGALGGLTSAYLGYRKNHSETKAPFEFTKFFDRVIMAVIVSVGLAIGSATDLVQLNLFTMFMIFVAALGTSELIMEIRNRNGSKKVPT